MIYVILGTKGQFIKMAPVLRELDKSEVNYKFIHTRQHTKITDDIIKEFNLKKPDLLLSQRKKDVINITDLVFWFLRCLIKNINNKKIFPEKGVAIIHGDTESTLLALIIAKLNGLKVAHIEAGLRSYNLLNPFPEEAIRLIVSKFSDYLFAPSDWAVNNLKKEKIKGKIFNTKANTVFDSVKLAVNTKQKIKYLKKPYVVALFHRKETLFVKSKTEFAVGVLEEISKNFNTLFVCHMLTKRKLEKYGLLDKIKNNSKIVFADEYLDYISFMKLVKNSEFTVADGGGLQEETTFLNRPCLLIRKVTERKEGLGKTEYLAKFDFKRVKYFLRNYKKFKRNEKCDISPSKYIYKEIKKFVDKKKK